VLQTISNIVSDETMLEMLPNLFVYSSWLQTKWHVDYASSV